MPTTRKGGLLGVLAGAAVVLGFALFPGCECAQNGHLEPVPFRASLGHNTVQCNCNLSFKHEACIGGTCLAHIPVELCLPPELNTDTVDRLGPAAAQALRAMDQDTFTARVDEYCRQTITASVYHLIPVFNGGWCEYKAPFAPDGGIGTSISCFAHPFAGGDEATRRDARTCTQPCPVIRCENANCGEEVQDDYGGIHLDQCRCTQVPREYACAGENPSTLPTPVFCWPGKE